MFEFLQLTLSRNFNDCFRRFAQENTDVVRWRILLLCEQGCMNIPSYLRDGSCIIVVFLTKRS